jgi:hypothetical protein
MSASAVVIAAAELMPGLVARAGLDGDALRFPDSEPLQALQAITEQRPPLVILERLFAASPRGAALINRIKNDPALTHAEVRVMSHGGDYVRIVSKPVTAHAPAAVGAGAPALAPPPIVEAPRPLDWHGTRRAPRVRVREGVEIQLDGNPARVVDLSVVGAQVLSAAVLRPNQKLRVALPHDDLVMRFRGAVAWAKFELARGKAPAHYRAGVEFADADPAALEAFCSRNREG